jgi:hypothetical protein
LPVICLFYQADQAIQDRTVIDLTHECQSVVGARQVSPANNHQGVNMEFLLNTCFVALIRTLLSPVISPDFFGSGRVIKQRKIDNPVICCFNKVIKA